MLCVEFECRGIGFESRHISELSTQIRDGRVAARCSWYWACFDVTDPRDVGSGYSGEEEIR